MRLTGVLSQCEGLLLTPALILCSFVGGGVWEGAHLGWSLVPLNGAP